MSVIKGWKAKLKEAQKLALVNKVDEKKQKVLGQVRRIPCAEDVCHDCAAAKGQFHVPGCDMERCPVCGGQAMLCYSKNHLNLLH